MNSTISVIVPLYNKRPHIARAIECILAQTSPADEIIIVNDASTDGSLDEVIRFNDPRIKIFDRSTPGPGGYAARNLGIANATSDWIAFLDADDSWLPHALEEARKLIKVADENVSCVFTGYRYDYGGRTETPKLFRPGCVIDHKRLNFETFINLWLDVGQSPMWTSAVVARKNSLLVAGSFPAGKCSRGGDKDTWLRLLIVGDALFSQAITAAYHRDSVNMVTKVENVASRPYLCSSLEKLLPNSVPRVGKSIRKLINWEIFSHARDAWRSHSAIQSDLYRGFFVSVNPLLYGSMVLYQYSPAFLLSLTHRLRDRFVRRRNGT